MDHKTILRHSLATMAFRTTHVLKSYKENYSEFTPCNDVMTPLRIINHMQMMMHYVDTVFRETTFEREEFPNLDDAFRNLLNNLQKLDKTIESLVTIDEDKILSMFQGPILDAMTHVGQLATLRRLSGDPIEGVKYHQAEIISGKFDY
ncbi:MAG: hypothetical protein DWP97_07175 [Calditrichaeota bacterium]|nr:MAG: hypothetical protein DWP97_07175 [Calditrichota bacterium]